MTEQLYRIVGKSSVTGKTLYGTVSFPLKLAQLTRNQLNSNLKNNALGLVYWVEVVPNPESTEPATK